MPNTVAITSGAGVDNALDLPARGLDLRSLYELAKPNLSLLVVVTAVIGFCLGAETVDVFRWDRLVVVIIGTALTSAGACALNMFIERDIDGRMPRTRKRPLPSRRVSPEGALFFALSAFSWGFAMLATGCGPLAAVLSMATAAIYAFCYTPLKRRGPISIWVGAIPGAVPPMIGWAAATGGLELGSLALFSVLFCWQFPHFIALAYMYREDYRRAGFRFLPEVDTARRTGRHIAIGGAAVLVASLSPFVLGLAGPIYAVGVVALGLWFLKVCLRASTGLTGKTARQAFLASITYLPLMLVVLVLDRLVL